MAAEATLDVVAVNFRSIVGKFCQKFTSARCNRGKRVLHKFSSIFYAINVFLFVDEKMSNGVGGVAPNWTTRLAILWLLIQQEQTNGRL